MNMEDLLRMLAGGEDPVSSADALEWMYGERPHVADPDSFIPMLEGLYPPFYRLLAELRDEALDDTYNIHSDTAALMYNQVAKAWDSVLNHIFACVIISGADIDEARNRLSEAGERNKRWDHDDCNEAISAKLRELHQRVNAAKEAIRNGPKTPQQAVDALISDVGDSSPERFA